MKEGIKRSAISRHIVLTLASFLLVIGMLALLIAQTSKAYAAESGEYKGISWEITDAGVLRLGSTEPQIFEDGDATDGENYIPVMGLSASEELRNSILERVTRWPWAKYYENIIAVEIVGNIKAIGSLEAMFATLKNVESFVGLDKIDVSEVYNLSSMFGYAGCEYKDDIGRWGWYCSGCEKVTSLNLSSWTTPNLVTTAGMFMGMKSLTNCNISNFDTSNVVEMNNMFRECEALPELNLSNIQTPKVKKTHQMFFGCKELTKIEGLDGFDVSKAEHMQEMFRGCIKLDDVDVSGWDTGSATNMNNMFRDCYELSELDVSGWNTENVTDMGWMFAYCRKLKSADMLELDMSKVTNADHTIRGCNALEAALNAKKTEAEAIAADPNATPEEKAAAQKKAENLRDALAAVTQLKGGASGAEAKDLIRAAADAYAQAVIDEAVADAEAKLAEAATKVNAAAAANATPADKKAAEDALKAAHDAADRVSKLANNTRNTSVDDENAATIQTNLANGPEAIQNNRLAGDLNTKLQEAANANTEGKSAASVKALNDAIEAANEALTNGDAAAKSKALADLEKATAGLNDKSNEEKAYDTAKAAADEAKAKADEAKAVYEAAKAKAEEEATKNPGSDAAVKAAEDAKKAAEDYAAKAKEADDKAKAAAEAANKTTDSAIKKAANDAAKAAGEEKKAADVANAEAAVANAEQLDKAVEKETDPVKKAELANKAAEAWKDAAGKIDAASESAGTDKVADIKAKADVEAPKAEKVAQTTSDAALTTAIADAKKADTSNATPESKKALEDAIANAEKVLADPASTPEQKAAAAKAVAEAQKNLTNVDVKPGDQFVFNNQKYEVLTVAANGNGTAALVKGKNAKSVTVPKTASYTEKGKTFDVTEINTKAFYKKTKKVTVGANVDTIDKQAFKGSKVATVVLKTKDLTKKSVKGALKGSKVKTVQVKVGSKKVNKKFVKKYKKIFTKKNAGKKVTVK